MQLQAQLRGTVRVRWLKGRDLHVSDFYTPAQHMETQLPSGHLT